MPKNMPILGTKQIEAASPVKTYKNAEESRRDMIEDSRYKSGIYRWINNVNGKTYVGSSSDLCRRIQSYYAKAQLDKESRPITLALLRYGHSSFSFEILEYCPKAARTLAKREQYYLDLLLPEYNVLRVAYSYLGHRGGSEETRKRLSIATKRYRANNPWDAERIANMKLKTTLREGVAVSVLNVETKEVQEYTTQTDAAKWLGITRPAIHLAIQRGSLVQGKYRVTKVANA